MRPIGISCEMDQNHRVARTTGHVGQTPAVIVAPSAGTAFRRNPHSARCGMPGPRATPDRMGAMTLSAAAVGLPMSWRFRPTSRRSRASVSAVGRPEARSGKAQRRICSNERTGPLVRVIPTALELDS